MTANSILTSRRTRIAMSVLLGGLFVYAGALKIGNPLALADTVAAFGILPNILVSPFALGLPVFEIISGLTLIAGWHRRAGTLALLIGIALYTTAVAWALARGVTIDCGCFGVGPATRAQMWWDLVRDLAILVGAATLYILLFRDSRSGRKTAGG